MILRQRPNWRVIAIGGYFFALVIYIMIGLMPAEAVDVGAIVTKLNIPAINLTADVTKLQSDGNRLNTPDKIVGSYSEANNKTLLIGHSSSVFQNLKNVKIGDKIIYSGEVYEVKIERLAMKEAIDMNEILAPADNKTLILMTCDGKMLSGGDATHRFILTAVIE